MGRSSSGATTSTQTRPAAGSPGQSFCYGWRLHGRTDSSGKALNDEKQYFLRFSETSGNLWTLP
eukprot:5919745-Heterocapsa_arctica.AAC.1